MRSRVSFLRGLAGMMLAGVVLGQAIVAGALAADVPGSQDYPLLGRYQGSEIVGYQVTEYDETTVLDGPFDPVDTSKWAGPGFKDVEGRIILIYYKLPEGRSTLEVMRNYEDSLKSKGFSIAFSCATSKGTCFQSGQPESGYHLGSAIGDPLNLPKLDTDYVNNWFQEGGRYLWRGSTGLKGRCTRRFISARATRAMWPWSRSSRPRRWKPARSNLSALPRWTRL